MKDVLRTSLGKISGELWVATVPRKVNDGKSVRYICRLGIGWFSDRSESDGAAPHYKMQDQRDHGEHQQQVNQSTRNVKHAKAGNPRNQQNHEQYCPNAHFTLLWNLRSDFASLQPRGYLRTLHLSLPGIW
jgi:hypothetical protein